MRILGLVVVKNEAERYLDACLGWHSDLLDDILVYDDWSTDKTVDIILRHKTGWTRRPDHVPTWLEHEGRFRQDSLLALEQYADLQPGDWVMGIDADEFLIDIKGNHRLSLDRAVIQAERIGAKSVVIPRPELWNITPPAERTDGFWGKIKCTRLFRWQPGGVIEDKPLGCGSEPTYVSRSKRSDSSYGLHLLHLGYADKVDRQEKFDRYSTLANHGHNDSHIKSILDFPTLRTWEGFMPPVWRGMH